MRISATTALNALQDAGVIQTWKRVRQYDDWREVYETNFNIVSDSIGMSNETYGRDSRMYVYAKNADVAQKAAAALEEAGVKRIGWNWCKDDPKRFEFGVTYFKGNRWWE